MRAPKEGDLTQEEQTLWNKVASTAKLFASTQGKPAYDVHLGAEMHKIVKKMHQKLASDPHSDLEIQNLKVVLDRKMGKYDLKMTDFEGKKQFFGRF